MENISRIVILGGPGDGLVALECILQMAAAGLPTRPAGFLNDVLEKGYMLNGLPVLGPLEAWPQLPDDWLFLPALHKLKAMRQRAERISRLGVPPHRWTSVVHPTAVLSGDARPGPGSYVGPYVVIQPATRLGAFLSLRSGANIGHDCVVGDYAYMGPNSVLCGKARLGAGAHLGPGAVLTDGVHTGEYCVVGAASSVLRDVPPYAVALGNPARVTDYLPTL